MPNLPRTQSLIAYDSHGHSVCADHGSRRCAVCCVDYTWSPYDSDDFLDGSDSEGNSTHGFGSDDERVFVLVGETARFTPQWDHQVQGPANVINRGIDNGLAPDTPDKLRFHYCTKCQLTWLVGESGLSAARSHPSHHTLHHIYAGTAHSAVVFVDGACPSNGTAATHVAIGAYFGLDSCYNISRVLQADRTTNQVAELSAAVEALRRVRTAAVPNRRALVRQDTWENSEDERLSACHFRLVVATDSSYLVENMCQNMEKWTFNQVTGQYKNRRGQAIKNSKELRQLSEEVRLLSFVGIQVVWYHVPRRFNQKADALANEALAAATRTAPMVAA